MRDFFRTFSTQERDRANLCRFLGVITRFSLRTFSLVISPTVGTLSSMRTYKGKLVLFLLMKAAGAYILAGF